MKHSHTILIWSILLFSFSVSAQKKNDSKLGINISQFQNDFGLGVHFLSPYFAKKTLAARIGINLQWLQHKSKSEIIWSPYGNIQLGVRGKKQIIDEKLFTYAEGGTTFLLPNSNFSSSNVVVGGYGLLGVEFMSSEKLSYFFEMGGIGTGAKADKLDLKPIYSNGFLLSTGLRFSL